MMEQRVSLITLGVADMERSAEFYEALGWRRVDSPDGVVAFDLIGQTLGLYPKDMLARDMGLEPSHTTFQKKTAWQGFTTQPSPPAPARSSRRMTSSGAAISLMSRTPTAMSGRSRSIRSRRSVRMANSNGMAPRETPGHIYRARGPRPPKAEPPFRDA